ncbi:MAG: efflux transporter periplasmic adaptor subunit [Bacteroidetes bacterium 4572_117]|nr:MAG: efflux transporter periplasmic adaptor subunit [Bacteroidetes bacterium 4572_117]
MRKYISIIAGVFILAIAILIAVSFIKNKKKKKPPTEKITKTVFVQTVKNKTIPLTITTSGNLKAKNKIDLFSEVQGVLKISSKDYKAGTGYQKGETILSINSDEHFTNLQSLKSNLYNALSAIMSDIRLDFPEEYEKWQAYLSGIDFDKPIAKIPETKSEKEKLFISGRKIYTNYFQVKNLEERLRKYTIRAPYDGILTEALVTPGSLVRQGQKLGEFINTGIFELEVSINTEYSHLLQKGNSVELANIEKTKKWQGKVARVNSKVDQASQTIKVYIQLRGKELREGMYLEAGLVAKSETNAFEVARNLLVDNTNLYIVQDSVLDIVEINPVYFNNETVVVKGLTDGSKVITKPVPGAYKGMRVEIKN